MTEKFTASNGVTVSSETQAITGHRRIRFETEDAGSMFEFSGEYMTALVEKLDHERDQELGRWRWPEDPGYAVTPAASEPGVVNVTNERKGVSTALSRARIGSHPHHEPFRRAASAYFAAHPAPKPWHDAKAGEVWVVDFEAGVTEAVVVPRSGWVKGLAVVAARRIYPGN